jgi:hypothetical protein
LCRFPLIFNLLEVFFREQLHGEYQGVTIKVLESITWEVEERALGNDEFKSLFKRTARP